MTTRRPDDPWFTVLYRNPHTLWWAPGAVVALLILLMDLLIFDRSAQHSLAIAALIGGTGVLGSYVRWRRQRR